MARIALASLCFLTAIAAPTLAWAVTSAEVYTSTAYGYGRVEARVRFAAGDGVVSSFFLWKDGSEVSGTFWNELDFEKVGADCHVETNAIYGNPSASHSQAQTPVTDPCGTYHTYAYEWTPEAISWLVDGVEARRETGATAAAFAENASQGMQIHFNVWPGDATFGGNFSPAILPVHQYVDWVQFSSYQNGVFTLDWREEFANDALPSSFLTGSWSSPKNLSTHDSRNVNGLDGFIVLSLTEDSAVGAAGAMPKPATDGGGAGSASGGGGGASGGSSGSANAGGALGTTNGGSPASTAGSTSQPVPTGVAGSAGSGDSKTTSGAGASAPTRATGCSVSSYGGADEGLLLSALALAASMLRRRRS